jgi:putative addiction module component (TIGR02574 family)
MSPETKAVFSLSPAEKLQLVEELWDDIARTPDDVPAHAWQIDMIEERKVALAAAPESGMSWEEMTAHIRSLKGGD